MLAILAVSWTQAHAQTTAPDPAARLRQNFDNCFYDSVAGQIKISRDRDVAAVAENAFIACQTEQEAILAYLNLRGLPPAQVRAMLIGVKIQLKNALRDIYAHPEKYIR